MLIICATFLHEICHISLPNNYALYNTCKYLLVCNLQTKILLILLVVILLKLLLFLLLYILQQ